MQQPLIPPHIPLKISTQKPKKVEKLLLGNRTINPVNRFNQNKYSLPRASKTSFPKESQHHAIGHERHAL